MPEDIMMLLSRLEQIIIIDGHNFSELSKFNEIIREAEINRDQCRAIQNKIEHDRSILQTDIVNAGYKYEEVLRIAEDRAKLVAQLVDPSSLPASQALTAKAGRPAGAKDLGRSDKRKQAWTPERRANFAVIQAERERKKAEKLAGQPNPQPEPSKPTILVAGVQTEEPLPVSKPVVAVVQAEPAVKIEAAQNPSAVEVPPEMNAGMPFEVVEPAPAHSVEQEIMQAATAPISMPQAHADIEEDSEDDMFAGALADIGDEDILASLQTASPGMSGMPG